MFKILLLVILFLIFLVLICIARLMWLDAKRKHLVGKKKDKVTVSALGKYIHQTRG